jgi:hypothetical protein
MSTVAQRDRASEEAAGVTGEAEDGGDVDARVAHAANATASQPNCLFEYTPLPP